MNLREVTTRFQTLCHDGYSEHQVYAEYNGKIIPIEKLKIDFKSDAVKDGYIRVKINESN